MLSITLTNKNKIYLQNISKNFITKLLFKISEEIKIQYIIRKIASRKINLLFPKIFHMYCFSF